MMEPVVSVVMPAYNSEKYIEAAIRSVQSQTMTEWELLVIDDGSSDFTCAIVERLAAEDSRIRFLKNQENMGTAKTRNRGLDLCRGEYVALLDSDDLWTSDKLEKQIDAAKKHNADLVYCSYAIVGETGEKKCNDFIVPEKTDLDGILKKSVISCSTALYLRKIASEFQFSADYYHEDYACWLSIIKAGKKVIGVPDVLASYRLHSQSRASNKFASAKRRWHIYRSYVGLSVPRSAYYLLCYAIIGIMKYRGKKVEQS